MTVSRQDFRDAMSRLGAAVNIVTSDGPHGRHGFTASAVCSVTDSPPTLLVCVNRDNESHDVLRGNGVLCVNTLTPIQRSLSPIFAGMLPGDSSDLRFESGAWGRLATGAPVLEEAAASFDCRITDMVEVGTHTVFFAEVAAIATGADLAGLIYFGRDYHPVGAAPAEA